MKFWLFSILSAFLLSACSGVTITFGPTATPELLPPSTATTVPVIHVVPSGASPEKQTVRVETHPQNNCGGSGDSKTIFSHQHAINYQLQFGQNWTISADGQVGIPHIGNVEVGTAVATYYGVSYGQTQVQSHSLELIAPAGKYMEHILRHVELWDTGTIVMTVVGQEHRIPYKFPVGYRIEQQDSVELVCEPRVGPVPIPNLPADSDTPKPNLSPDHACTPSPHDMLGNSWSTPAKFVLAQQGEIKVFSHCPPAASIRYSLIAVDDEIAKVERVCRDSVTDITNQFEALSVPNELLIHYRSSNIDLLHDCRIDFTIRDTLGEQIGLWIKLSSPGFDNEQSSSDSPLITVRSFTPIEDVEVLANDGDGESWTVPSTGTFRISYKDGAYSSWSDDTDCPIEGCWKTTTFIYRDCNITRDWRGDLMEPVNPQFRLGLDPWQVSSEVAERLAQNSDPVQLDLQAGECLKFITIDGVAMEGGNITWSAYSDNRGSVTLGINVLQQ